MNLSRSQLNLIPDSSGQSANPSTKFVIRVPVEAAGWVIMFAVVGNCVFKKAPVSTYKFSIPISKISWENLTKDQSLALWWLFYWFLLPFLLFIYRYCEEIIDVGHTRDLFKGLRKPYYSFTNETSRETANHGRRLQQIGGLMLCSKRNWREPSALNLWNSGYPAVDFWKKN